MYRNTFVEIDLDAVAANAQSIKSRFKDYEYFFGVLKGGAYGHGEYIVNTLVDNGVNYIAVSDISEALAVRKFNKTIPILCLIPVNQEFLEVCIENNLTITVHDLDYAHKLAKQNLAKRLKVHLKIDSGMHRLGFTDKKDLELAFKSLKDNKNIEIEGIYTHFATSGIYDPHYNRQTDSFLDITSLIPLNEIRIVHADRSLTVMSHSQLDFTNGMRIGISLYGFSQLPKSSIGLRGKLRLVKNRLRAKLSSVKNVNLASDIVLKPALSMFSEVVQVKNAPQGSLVGYGETLLKTSTQLAVIPTGYADGIDLRRTGSFVLIGGERCQIVGTINMNSIVVSTRGGVKAGDKAEIIGPNISVREVSAHIGTTIYETMTSISPNISRIYIRNGKTIHVED